MVQVLRKLTHPTANIYSKFCRTFDTTIRSLYSLEIKKFHTSMPICTAVRAHRNPVTTAAHEPADTRGCTSKSWELSVSHAPSSFENSFSSSLQLSNEMTNHRSVYNHRKSFQNSFNFINGHPLSSKALEAFDKVLRSSPSQARRFFAKGKSKPGHKKAINIDEDEIGQLINLSAFKTQMQKELQEMKDEYTKQLNLRGAAGALESLVVEFEEEKYPLQELAQVGRKNPQMAILNLSSLPDAIQPVLKAIQESGMNLNPQQEGTTIYVPLPKITREHREQLAKNAKSIFNKYRNNFQSTQNKFIKQCKSKKDVSEDLNFSVQQQLHKITEQYLSDAEGIMKSKQKELLGS